MVSSIQNLTFPKPKKAGMNHAFRLYRGQKRGAEPGFRQAPRLKSAQKRTSLPVLVDRMASARSLNLGPRLGLQAVKGDEAGRRAVIEGVALVIRG